ncbi:hypothetical protein F0562_020776 [Nyssa sinensis]|uniref:UBZ3-type domain-containing protein n=1 Tax=Nyssa sinensis TaxID=561372 RepID=A0A5J5BRM9_9ASTE|nr:hypothetical protein F0562_020776 [Nyssa sinensis]
MGDHVSLSSDISGNHCTLDTETGVPRDHHETSHYDIRDPLDSNQISDLDWNNCMSSNNTGEKEKRHGPLNCKFKDQVNTPGTLKVHKTETSELVETDSLSGQSEGSSLDQVKKRALLSDGEAMSSRNQKEPPFLWVDDYKCSLCGVELPPSFVEERQEHSDFHLAERLQEEESGNNFRNHIMKQRFIQKDNIVTPSRGKKKHKSSPSGEFSGHKGNGTNMQCSESQNLFSKSTDTRQNPNHFIFLHETLNFPNFTDQFILFQPN